MNETQDKIYQLIELAKEIVVLKIKSKMLEKEQMGFLINREIMEEILSKIKN